jgi:hypothetical protein
MNIDIENAKADILATGDLLEKALKLAGLVASLKTKWTWEEWKASRAATRAVSEMASPGESSSDKRLRAAFDGERAPSAATPHSSLRTPNFSK